MPPSGRRAADELAEALGWESEETMIASLESGVSLDLTSVLVRIARERGVPIERLRAEQLVEEAKAAWPGEEQDQWATWLSEAGASLSLPARMAELPVDEVVHLAEDGAMLVANAPQGPGAVLVVGSRGPTAEVGVDELDASQPVSMAELSSLVGGGATNEARRWLVFELPAMGEDHSHEHLEEHPIRRIWGLLTPDRSDIWVITVFAFFAGVLSLATPIAVEALVNTVAFGQLLQPVIVLSILLFGSLIFAAGIRALQVFVVEIIQQRLFVRIAADLAYRLPRIEHKALDKSYGPELVNRFLDVVTMQKAVAHLLLDGIAIALATLVGMAVLAFYHPWLLGFDLLLIGVVILGLYVLGRGAIATGIDESKMKYKLTSWLQDTIRCQSGFKLLGGAAFAMDRANYLAAKYIGYRKAHFRRLFRQILFILVLQAIAGTVLLAFGGWLVIQEQLSLGQLVAAEFIVAMILGSMAKLGKHLEGFYDLVAASDKVGILLDLPTERRDGVLHLPQQGPLSLDFHEVRHAFGGPTLRRGLTFSAEPGERLAVYGPRGSGKSTLVELAFGLRVPEAGRAEVGGVDPCDVRPDVLRGHVAMVRDPEIFEGDLAENVHLRRTNVTQHDVRHALAEVGLLYDLLKLPSGLETHVTAAGAPLSDTQQLLLMFARAIVAQPQLLLIDGALDRLPDADLERVLQVLADPSRPWTLLVTTGKRAIASMLDRAIQLEGHVSVATRASKAPPPR